jgi:hypothetical protein
MVAGLAQPARSGGDHLQGAIGTQLGHQFAATADAGIAIAQLDVRLDRVEQGGRQGDDAVSSESIGHRADVRVHPEDLLQHDHRPARGLRRTREPGPGRACGGIEVDPFAHDVLRSRSAMRW